MAFVDLLLRSVLELCVQKGFEKSPGFPLQLWGWKLWLPFYCGSNTRAVPEWKGTGNGTEAFQLSALHGNSSCPLNPLCFHLIWGETIDRREQASERGAGWHMGDISHQCLLWETQESTWGSSFSEHFCSWCPANVSAMWAPLAALLAGFPLPYPGSCSAAQPAFHSVCKWPLCSNNDKSLPVPWECCENKQGEPAGPACLVTSHFYGGWGIQVLHPQHVQMPPGDAIQNQVKSSAGCW